ncbi:hypothetical protein WJU16_23680 [Chitinophaga pollutisoli]|uniref:Uncharacterized protein n=1 Tax=Chitinophaga pollutisoli TaxID=3133966 RepID=A0ABZ2YMH6_9BACT
MLRTILLLCAAIAFFACKKSRQPQPQQPSDVLQGTWTGRYGYSYGNELGDTVFAGYLGHFKMEFFQNGKLIVHDLGASQSMKANGTYIRNGKKLYARYKYEQGTDNLFSFHATFEKDDSLAGKWFIGYDGPTGGEFFVKR